LGRRRPGKVLTIERPFRPFATRAEEEELKARWIEVIHPDDRPELIARWTHSLATGEPFRCEFRSQLTDASMRWTRSQAIAVSDDEGRVTGVHGSAEDIHDGRIAEEARREVEES
jgi:PAS domain S-box-containing protein